MWGAVVGVGGVRDGLDLRVNQNGCQYYLLRKKAIPFNSLVQSQARWKQTSMMLGQKLTINFIIVFPEIKVISLANASCSPRFSVFTSSPLASIVGPQVPPARDKENDYF